MRTAALLLAGVLTFEVFAAPAAALAQAVEPGTRIRLSGDWPGVRRRVGTFVIDERDSIWIRESPASHRSIFWPAVARETTLVGLSELDVQQLEISRGLHRDGGLSVLVGTLAGAGLGALIGAAAYDPADTWGLLSKSEMEGALALVLGVGGCAIGGIISLTRRTEKWEAAPIESLERSVASADSMEVARAPGH